MATQETIKQITQGGVTRDVEDTTARQGLTSKVDKNGTDSLMTAAERTKLAGIAAGAQVNVINSISVNGTQQTPVQGNVDISLPTKVSELENDEGYVTAQDVAGIVAATGDLTIVESGDYIDILISHPELVVTQLAPMSASTKSGTFKVSGTHLKGDVTISTSATNWTLSADGGTTTSQSLTLSPTDGTLAETTITVAYSGTADSTGNTITIASSGATSVDVTANYTVYAGPTILVSPSSLSFSAAPNATQEKTLTVTGSNLSDNISAALSGTNTSLFSVAGTLTSSGGTLTITYSPTAEGTHSASLVLSSTGAESVTVALSATAEAAVEVDENGRFTKGGIHYGIIDYGTEGATDLAVYNDNYDTSSSSNSGGGATVQYSGDIVIPSTVTVNGTTYTVTTIKTNAFRGHNSVTSITLPNTITTIEGDSIRGITNNSFTSFTIPDSVTSLGNNLCNGCTKLSTINIGTGVTTLPAGTFGNIGSNSAGLKVTIPANVTTWHQDAFSGSYLDEVTFLSGALSINAKNCRMNDGSKVTIYGDTKPTISGGYPFARDKNGSYAAPYNSPATLYVPSTMVSTYSTSAPWGVADGSGNVIFPAANDKIQSITE